MKYALLAAILLFTACDRKPPPPKIAEPQRQALDKAKAVEQTMQKEADETRRKIEDAAK